MQVMEWISKLYKETYSKWQATGADENGYAIFYTPIIIKPKFLIIGYNPGGSSKDFSAPSVPIKHDYVAFDYRLATNMRKVFQAAQESIEDTVKFNIIFFRSKSAKDLKSKDLIDFSIDKTKDILNNIHSELIITEGFKTFEMLLNITNGRQTKVIPSEFRQRTLAVIGRTEKDVKIIGLLHPSGARPTPSDTELEQMGKIIKAEKG